MKSEYIGALIILSGSETMAATLEENLISVWRQALVDESRAITVNGISFPVQRTSRSRLREVDFRFEDQPFRGLEQNPETASRWAQLAREGKRVMQFLSAGRYIAVVVDGTVQFYGRTTSYAGQAQPERTQGRSEHER